jgi:hypothetical protein
MEDDDFADDETIFSDEEEEEDLTQYIINDYFTVEVESYCYLCQEFVEVEYFEDDDICTKHPKE